MRKFIVWTTAGLLLGVWVLGSASGTLAQDGQKTFSVKCAACHGQTGKGDGPLAKNFDPKPKDLCLPEFWQGDVDQKISDAVNKGKGQMVPVKLSPDELKAVIAYMKSSCRR